MPLSKIQTDVLRLLAAHRDPESFGATPLNRAAPRFSGDIDVFHDRQERVTQAALNDAAIVDRGELAKPLDVVSRRFKFERYKKSPAP